MSQNQVALPDTQTAVSNLFDGLYPDVFFQKLASLGIELFGTPAQRQKQAQDLVDMALWLRNAEEQHQVKVAEESPYAGYKAALAQSLGVHGLDAGIKQSAAQEQDLAIRQIAACLAGNPDLYNSVLAVKAAQMEQDAQYQQQRQVA